MCEAKLEDLDHGRDEMRFETWNERTGSLKSLEASLDLEKRRLIHMETQLTTAKKLRNNRKHFSIIKKNSKVLLTVAKKMSQALDKESIALIEWNDMWQEKLSLFQKPCRDMEEQLKSRHIQELRALETDLQRSIRHLAIDASRKKNSRMPSPRSLSLMQEERAGRFLALFHKQAGERLILATKVSLQEEQLMRSKNQNLHKTNSETERVALKCYQQFNLQPVANRDTTSAAWPKKVEPELDKKKHLNSLSYTKSHQSQSTENPQNEKKESMIIRVGPKGLMNALNTPRLDNENCTFLTEVEFNGIEKNSSKLKSSVQPVSESQILSEPCEATGTAREKLLDSNEMSSTFPNYISSESLEDQSIAFKDSRSFHNSLMLKEEVTISGLGSSCAKNQQERDLQWEGRKSLFFSQVIAPTYPAPKGGRHDFKKTTISPYLMPQMAESNVARKSAKVSRAAVFRAPSSAEAENDPLRSANTPSKALGSVKKIILNSSTLPFINQSELDTGRLSSAVERAFTGTDNSRTVFPHLKESISKNGTNVDLDLPGVVDSGGEKSETFQRLESWIEAKIRTIISNSKDTTHTVTQNKEIDFSKSSEVSEHQSIQSPSKTSRENASPSPRCSKHANNKSVVSEGNSKFTVVSDDGRNSDIGNLLTRLRSTMNSKQENHERTAQTMGAFRNGIEKPPTVPGNEGLGFYNPKVRSSELSSRTDFYKGQDIRQEESDGQQGSFTSTVDEDEYDARKEEERLKKAGERRKQLDDIDLDRATVIQTKKVGWSLDDTAAGSQHDSSLMADGKPKPPAETSPSSFTETSKLNVFPLPSPDFEYKPNEMQEPANTESFELERDFFSLVRHNKVKEFEEILLSSKLSVDTRDRYGNTPLMISAQNGHKRLVKLCLLNNADLNVSNYQGNTALHYAFSYGYTTVANYLISKGADDTLINHQGKTCYEK